MNLPTQRYTQDLRRYYRMPAVQTSLTLVLSLFVMAIFIVFALRPTMISIVTLKKTITESESTLAKLKTKITNLQKASSQLDSIKFFLPTLNTSVPNTSAMYAPLTASIEVIATQNQVLVEGESVGSTLLFSRVLSPFTPNKSQSVITLPLTIKVSGAYPNAMNFLKDLLSMERLIMVESITITKEAGSNKSTQAVAINITGNAYYLADEQQLKKSLVVTKEKK